MSERSHPVRDDIVYHAFKGLMAGAGRLPLSLTRPMGSVLGRVAMALNPRDRRRSREHIRIAFPDLDETGVRELLRANARHIGMLAAEVAWLGHADPASVLAMCDVSGEEHLWQALDLGNGTALVTGHCGNWEFLNAWLGVVGLPMTIAVRDIYDPRLDHMATSFRARFGAEVVARGATAGRRLLSALAKNRVIGLLIDQDIGDIPGVFVPFFGRAAWTPLGAASLALHRECSVIQAFAARQPNGRFAVEVHPPFPLPTSGSKDDRIVELTTAITAGIERFIRAHPAQWVWMHRRWRTQPPPAQLAVSS